MTGKIEFIVVDENILCYTFPTVPHLLGVLSSSVIRGATIDRLCGEISRPTEQSRLRPAVKKDFDTFRISSKEYEASSNYAFPTH